MKDVFPLPDGPQTATFSPCLIVAEMFASIGFSEVLFCQFRANNSGEVYTYWYLALTLSNCTSPVMIQFVILFSEASSSSSSRGVSFEKL